MHRGVIQLAVFFDQQLLVQLIVMFQIKDLNFILSCFPFRAEMETKRTELSEELSRSRHDLAAKVEQLEALETQQTKLLAETDALREQHKAAQVHASRAEAALVETQGSLKKLKSEHAGREAKYTLLLDNLEKLNGKKTEELSKLKAQFASLKGESNNTVEAMGELRKYVTSPVVDRVV